MLMDKMNHSRNMIRAVTAIICVLFTGSALTPGACRAGGETSPEIIVDLPRDTFDRIHSGAIPFLKMGRTCGARADVSPAGTSGPGEYLLGEGNSGIVTLTGDPRLRGGGWDEYRYLVYDPEPGPRGLPSATEISFFARRSAKFTASTEALLNPFLRPIDDLAYYGSGDANLDDVLNADDLTAIEEIIAETRDPNEPADTTRPTAIDTRDYNCLQNALEGTSLLPSAWVYQAGYPRNQWLSYTIEIDTVNSISYDPPWVCMCFASLLQINYAGYSGSLEGTAYDPDDPAIHAAGHIFPGRFNLPLYYVGLRNDSYSYGHAINAILMGDDPRNFSDWKFIEPQNDGLNIQPGDYSMPLDYGDLTISISFPHGFAGGAPRTTIIVQFTLFTDATTELIYTHPDLIVDPPAAPTPSSSPTPTGSPSPTPTSSPTPTVSPTATTIPVKPAPPTATPTIVQPATPTPWDRVTPTPVNPATPTATPTIVQPETPTPSERATPTPVKPAMPTATPTIPPQQPPTPSPSPSPAPTGVHYRESGDYDGDGTTDIAVFRPGSGLWAARGTTRVYFGGVGDLPVPGDYKGDGTTGIGIFRPASGLWAIRGVTRSYFGGLSDTAIPGDYDGDGSCDIGIFRKGSGLWAVRGVTRAYLGTTGDTPVSGYYNGDGQKVIGIFRPALGLWALRGVSRFYFGSPSDGTIPGDYNGDGTWEAGIFRPSSGLWAIRGMTRAYFGGSTDTPVPADYDGDRADEIGVFRPASGLWAIRGLSRAYFGRTGDTPVVR